MKEIPGISRQEEEQRLKKTLTVAQRKVENTQQNVLSLAQELHAMQQEFDEADKEMQALWHTADDRLKHVKEDLNRALQARKKPYFGRIDFTDKKIGEPECYYIGRSVIAEDPAYPMVIDWRAPIAGVYYDASLGEASYAVKGEGKYEIELQRKRTYEIEGDVLKDFYDSDVVANDELLTKYLAKSKRSVLSEIVATIQQEQNEVIRKKPQHNLIVQGAAGSGKTTVAMHRISYILYNYEQEFAPEDFYIIGSNQVLLNYITGVLPELNVYGVSQMTMEQLFVRLLYEDWDRSFEILPVKKGVTPPIKGTFSWFHDLEEFCERYEKEIIPRKDVCIEKNGVVLMTSEDIQKVLERSGAFSRADKISSLTEYLMAKFENEISGKYYSYSLDEKRRLTAHFSVYFGKRQWKGSIFELYTQFLEEQNIKGYSVPIPEKCFDVYDLAALAYLYKRIKEDQIIREAGHVVIDEAQDFGMMVYGSLKYCLSKCTYTIMGDVSQNIWSDYGLNDWQELRELMLPGEFDYFGLLRKSYRNTVEISNFATDILCHGSFYVYPAEPIVRHGKEVLVEACTDREKMLEKTLSTVQRWIEEGMETIAVICSDDAQTEEVKGYLSGKVPLLDVADKTEFGSGIMVLPLVYTKGLEFDATLLYDVSEENYPMEDGYVKRLYVAATRALHELVVLYTGSLSGLIAEPVTEERIKKVIVEPTKTKSKMPEQEEKTNEQIYKEQAAEAELERVRRDKYGPRRIEVQEVQKEVYINHKRNFLMDDENVKKLPTYMERRQTELEQEKRRNENYVNLGEFGEMPSNEALAPEGHNRIDCSVRIAMKGNGYYDIISNYGTMRITPISQECVRVCFAKGQCNSFPETAKEMAKTPGKYKTRETIQAVEIMTEKLLVRVDKKTGAVGFYKPKGELLLCENGKLPRQIGSGKVWTYFDFSKKESLFARDLRRDGKLKIANAAKYISYGKSSGEMPALMGTGGYELWFPKGHKVLCCTIPMYGLYVSTEDVNVIDYYFKVR